MNILDRVKFLTTQHHMTIAELERKLDFSQGSISRWNKQSPSSQRLQKVAEYFDVSTDYLLGLTDDPYSASNLDGNSDTKTFKSIQRGASKLSKNDQLKLLKIMKAAFDQVEGGDFHDDSTEL